MLEAERRAVVIEERDGEDRPETKQSRDLAPGALSLRNTMSYREADRPKDHLIVLSLESKSNCGILGLGKLVKNRIMHV